MERWFAGIWSSAGGAGARGLAPSRHLLPGLVPAAVDARGRGDDGLHVGRRQLGQVLAHQPVGQVLELLANAYQTLASANAMACDLAFDLDGSRRHVALAIQQMIELGQLLVNRVLDVEHGHG